MSSKAIWPTRSPPGYPVAQKGVPPWLQLPRYVVLQVLPLGPLWQWPGVQAVSPGISLDSNRRPQRAQKNPKFSLQSTRPRVETPPVHTSAAGEKKTIQVPKPALSKPATDAERTLFTTSSSESSQGLKPRAQQSSKSPGMASKTISTPKQAAPSSSSCSLQKAVTTQECKDRVPASFIDERLKFSSHLEALEKARMEERVAYDGSPSKNIYETTAMNTLGTLKGLTPSAVPGLNRATLYGHLQGYLLTEDQRKENGYPFPHPKHAGDAVVFSAQQPQRSCCRCGTRLAASASSSSSGRFASTEQCHYHCGRLLSRLVAGGWDKQYTCCSRPIGAMGCQVAKRHVQDGRTENLRGFVQTYRKELGAEAHPGIYAVDCEMSYTTQGLELTRVSVVDTEMRMLYDTFVKPDNEIVDYNTRFSGVTEADLASTDVRLRDVQAVLLTIFSADTILIGHSLQSDLLALKLIHSSVVDTSVLFPHPWGLPYKRSLRSLAAQHLRRTIQANKDGHSSREDAGACMQLVMRKIQEDAQTSSGLCPSPTLSCTRPLRNNKTLNKKRDD